MVTIHETPKSRFLQYPGRSVKCPHCKKELAFYGTAPNRCANCKVPLINFLSILTNKIYRANYHTGIVDDTGHVRMLAG